MNLVAIIGLLKAGNEIALTVRSIIDQWRADNPDEPLPPELEDATLIQGFADAISGARGTYADLIGRLEARVAGEQHG